MPELPEVETVMQGLAKAVRGKTIARIQLGRKQLRIPFPKALKNISGAKIKSLHRRAKYIVMDLDNGQSIILHLGMSGRVTINPDHKKTHDHMTVDLTGGTRIVFNDPRRFGLVDLCKTQDLHKHRFFAHLGPEPLEKNFDAKYLAQKLAHKKIAVKVAIMDQKLVVGVGNIYASEALFGAHISPLRTAGSLTAQDCLLLTRNIKTVLKRAIAAGGSSLRDYVQSDGSMGYFQFGFAVYDRAGEKCKTRGCKGVIQKTVQAARSTFYCPDCQK